MRQQAHPRPVVDPDHQGQDAEAGDDQADGHGGVRVRTSATAMAATPSASTPSCSQGMPGPPPRLGRAAQQERARRR